MAGLVFPDLAGTLARVASMEGAQAQRDWLDQDRAAKAEIAPLIPKALQGDTTAQGQIATKHPDTFMKIVPMLERLDANQRARAKEAAEYTTQTGLAILNAPAAQQPQLYERARQDAQARGIDVSKWPTQFMPDWVKFNVDRAMPIAEHFKRMNEAPVPVGPAGGDQAPSPGQPGDVLGRTKQAIAGNESAGQPNGGYGAVGPDTGKGRAYGKYQIMDFNIGPWTQEALGRQMTPQEFLANPRAQEAVADHKLGQYIKQFGSPEAAARAWFAGPAGMNNAGAKDVLGTTVGGYGQKFAQTYGAGATGAGGAPATPPGVAVGDNVPADGSGNPVQQAQFNGYAARDLTAALPPGARFVTRNGKYNIQNDIAEIMHPDGSLGLVRLPPKKEQSGGPFTGTSTEAQALNMLIANGTLTSQQAAELAAGKTITNPADGSVLFMTPSGIFQRPAGGAQAPTPVGAPAPATPSVPPAAASAGNPAPAAPAAAPASAAPNGMIQITGPKGQGPTPKEQADLRTARVEAKKMTDALEDFRKQFTDASVGDRAKALTGTTTPLNTSYNVAALLAKGEQLFNLGVLNGPDLEIIRRTLPDPSTLRGALTAKEDMSAAVDKVIAVLNGALAEKERQLGMAASPTKGQAPQGAERDRTLFDARKAIQQGAPREAVIERLRGMGIEPEGL